MAMIHFDAKANQIDLAEAELKKFIERFLLQAMNDTSSKLFIKTFDAACKYVEEKYLSIIKHIKDFEKEIFEEYQKFSKIVGNFAAIAAFFAGKKDFADLDFPDLKTEKIIKHNKDRIEPIDFQLEPEKKEEKK